MARLRVWCFVLPAPERAVGQEARVARSSCHFPGGVTSAQPLGVWNIRKMISIYVLSLLLFGNHDGFPISVSFWLLFHYLFLVKWDLRTPWILFSIHVHCRFSITGPFRILHRWTFYPVWKSKASSLFFPDVSVRVRTGGFQSTNAPLKRCWLTHVS